MKPSLPQPDPTPGFFKRRRLWLILAVTVFLLLVLDLRVRMLLSRPGLIERNRGTTYMAVPYMINHIRRGGTESVAWVGSSSMQSENAALENDTYPALVAKSLRDQGIDITSYNLAQAGNVIPENACLAFGAMDAGVDVLVFELLYEPLGGHGGTFTRPPTHIDALWFCEKMPQFNYLLSPLFHVRNRNYVAARPALALEHHWKLMENRNLLLWLFTGSFEGPAVKIADDTTLAIGARITRKNYNPPSLPRIFDNPYHWQKAKSAAEIRGYGERLRQKQQAYSLSEDMSEIQLMAIIADEATKKGVPVLYFFPPVNEQMLRSQMDWDHFERFKSLMRQQLQAKGSTVLDLTEAIPSKYFVDHVHMNRTGLALVAQKLEEPVKKLAEGAAK